MLGEGRRVIGKLKEEGEYKIKGSVSNKMEGREQKEEGGRRREKGKGRTEEGEGEGRGRKRG